LEALPSEQQSAESGGDGGDAGVRVCDGAFSILAAAGWDLGAGGHGDAENAASLR
jgi:hypothetical protein